MSVLAPEIESTYEVLREMGGGMGAVYKVRHRIFGETRVIKVMQAAIAGNEALQDRFIAEARRGKQLKHRNLAGVLDFQIGSDGKPYLVMEYVEGANLRELMRDSGPLDAASVVSVGVQTLAALGYLHERNLIHRDISPDNLMVAPGENGAPVVKLIDLGIAKSLDETNLTRTGTFMGKLAYASPEQFSGLVDARSDLYSLGVVLYELLTGAMPISGSSTAALIMAHCHTPPRPFVDTDPAGRVPEALRQVVMKALAKDPADRYETAVEFSVALDSAVPEAGLAAWDRGDAPLTTVTATAQPEPATIVDVTPVAATQVEGVTRPAAQTTMITASKSQPGASYATRLLAAAAFIAVGAFALTAFLVHAVDAPSAEPRVVQTQTTTTTAAPAQTAAESIVVVAPKPVDTAQPQVNVKPVDQVVRAAAPPPSVTPIKLSQPVTRTASPASIVPPVVTQVPPSAEPPPARTVSRSPGDLSQGDAQRKQALAFSSAHQWQKAVPAWQAFIRDYSGINPSADHAAYYNLGVAREELRLWSDAADAFEHAATADIAGGADTSNLLHLARCYGKLGRWSDAASTYERVLRLEPENYVAKRNLLLAIRQQPRSR